MRNINDFKNLLLKQYELYPKMQIQDMVKLIYQNEFAGGHLIVNKMDSFKRLEEEYNSLKSHHLNRKESYNTAFEDIGNGLCRLHLSSVINADIDLITINMFFINTANSICGNNESFKEKLGVLKQCCKDEILPFCVDELETYLVNYEIQGYPPVSHSESYKLSYQPSYRIVKGEYAKYLEVFCEINSLVRTRDNASVNVAIDGKSGSGKSTLSNLLSEVYDCNVFHMDDFFLTPDLKVEPRMKEVGGNVDYVRFNQEVIYGLRSGLEFQYQIYDCKQLALTKFVAVTPKKLNIVEGVYSMHPTLMHNYDLKVFLNIEEEKQSSRILKRNGAFMHEKFINEWIPKENQYFKEMKIQEQSDIVIYI